MADPLLYRLVWVVGVRAHHRSVLRPRGSSRSLWLGRSSGWQTCSTCSFPSLDSRSNPRTLLREEQHRPRRSEQAILEAWRLKWPRPSNRCGGSVSGAGLWAYALITGLFSVLVFQPELVAGAIFRLADLLNLFISQLGFAF